MSITAIFELPVPVWVSTDAYGEIFQSGFGDLKFDVYMPNRDGAVGEPPVVEGLEIPSVLADAPAGELIRWAQVFAGWLSEPAVALCRVVLRTRDSGRTDADAQYDLARRVEWWFDAVRTWAEALSGQDLDPKHPVYDATDHGVGLTMLDPARDGGGPLGMTLTTRHITPVSDEGWRVALSQVAAGVLPPPEEVLSRDARAAYARGQYRRAISDAATAVEIVLHRVVKEAVSPGDMPNAKWRNKLKAIDAQPIGGLVSLARQADLSLTVDLDDLDELAAVRNRAIHHAETPGWEKTLKSVNLCILMLGTYGPWRRDAFRTPDGTEWAGQDAVGDPVPDLR